MTALPADLGLVLVDEQTNARRYLRTVTDYRFILPEGSQSASFRIETTSRGALQVLTLTAHASSGRGGGLQIQYSLTQEAMVIAELRSPTGKLVRRLTGGRAPALTMGSLCWDGRAEDGAQAPNGIYLVVLTATGADQRTVRAMAPCAVK